MNYRSLHVIYFSPTHSSAKIIYAIAEGIGVTAIMESDVTCEDLEFEELISDELTIIAAPVYGGRVAETAMERFRKFRSDSHAPIVPVVLYGNRDYEDALRELSDLMEEQGFVTVAGGAFIGEHSFSRPAIGMPIAEGRPDKDDLQKAFEFGKKIREKIEAVSDIDLLPPVQLKGNFPYKVKGKPTPLAPVTNEETCVLCGYCMDICPTHAISMKEGKIVSDPNACIKCCACVKECPEGARTFDTPYTEMLFKNFSARREPEVFL